MDVGTLPNQLYISSPSFVFSKIIRMEKELRDQGIALSALVVLKLYYTLETHGKL